MRPQMAAVLRFAIRSLVVALCVTGSPAFAAALPSAPDPKLTPGAVLPVGPGQICRPGYSRAVRHVTAADKREVFARYGLRNAVVDVTTRNGDTVKRSD